MKDMLKKTLTNYLFLGLLSSVRSEGSNSASDFDFRTSLVESFKDKCSELLDQSACIYWDSPEEDTGLQSIKTIESQQQDGLSSENDTVSRKQFPEANSEQFFDDYRNNINKRFNVFRRRNPNAQGYKRGPGFRSWGGKRDFQSVQNPLPKKTKFTSWGGKRDDFSEKAKENDKRSKFVNWGGKRDFEYSSDKRTGFKSWGGKRTIPFEHSVKNDGTISNSYEMDKRSPIWKEMLYLNEPNKKHFPKRPQFQSWGGKRALYPLHRFLELFYARPVSILNGEKRKFSSWGGKRNYENQKNAFEGVLINEIKRHNFQSWGGKRAFDQDAHQIEKRETIKGDLKNEYSDSGINISERKRREGR